MNNPGQILLPIAYFPPVSYFVHLLSYPVIHIEQMETFPKQTYRNRCVIMTEAGKSNLIVPVSKPHGNHTMTKDIEISYREPWQQHHWKTLQSGYRSSPFFNYYDEIIYHLFTTQERLLLNHNINILKTLGKLIGIEIKVQLTTDFLKQAEGMFDLRSVISPKKQLSSNEFPSYPQVFEHKFGFKGGLSILDLLFNTGPDTLQYLKRISQTKTSD